MTGTTPRSVTALLTVIVLVAACGAASTPPAPSPAATTPGVTSQQVTPAPPTQSSPTATPAAEPIDALTPGPLVLGGTWLRPKANARLTSYTTILSAKPTAAGTGVTTFTKVVFSATWAGTTKTVMCKATTPAASGAWTCKANLLALGVPPGKVTFSFDVYGEGVPVARSPDGPRRVTYAVPPPRPAKTRWEMIEPAKTADGGIYPDCGNGTGVACPTSTYRLRWSAPAGYADEFLVYDTWECPRDSKKGNVGTPCFVVGTPVDVSGLELLARAPGDARSVKVRLTEPECGPSYSTILLRARNAYGRSVFAIVETVTVPDPNDMIC